MRIIPLQTPCTNCEQPELLAWLVRHLDARLHDFGPGGPEVLLADQTAGLVAVRFPGHDTGAILSALSQQGITAAQDGDRALFWLSPDIPFENLDRLWGCLFDVLA